MSAIPYLSLDSIRREYPDARFVNLKDIKGIEDLEARLHRGIYKVMDSIHNVWCIYKEPTAPVDIKSQVNEIRALTLLSNFPHIIQLLGFVVSTTRYLSFPGDDSPLVLRGVLLQYASQGALGRVLEVDDLQWHRRLRWAKQIALGLREIHAAALFHGDLKSYNIVIDDSDNAIIIDFGGRGGTYGWNAPETYVDQDQPEPGLMAMQKADVYSFGVVLWEILTQNEVNIPIGMKHAEFFRVKDTPEHEGYIKLMRHCLLHDPEYRPNIAEIIENLEELEREL